MGYFSFTQSEMYKQSSFELDGGAFLNIAWSYFRKRGVWSSLWLDPQGALSFNESIFFSGIYYLTEWLFLTFCMSYDDVFQQLKKIFFFPMFF